MRLFVGLIFFLAVGQASATAAKASIMPVTFEELAVTEFSAQLGQYVNDGVVDYQRFAANAEYDRFVEQVRHLNLESLMSPEERLAFYINAYNALAIKGVLDGRSPKSFTSKIGFFYLSEYQVAGESINLYDLEHKRIRTLDEPRIHFALVCAALSCPKLRSEAYTPKNLYQQLDDNARDFLNDEFKNQFDKQRKTARLSKIFKWFKEDFETDGQTLQEYIARYVSDPEVAADLAANRYKIKYLPYNWKLNGKL